MKALRLFHNTHYNIQQLKCFKLLIVFSLIIQISEEVQDYEYEPYHSRRSSPPSSLTQYDPQPTPSNLETNVRSQSSHYRNIYRNRNYYAKTPKSSDLTSSSSPQYGFKKIEKADGKLKTTTKSYDGRGYSVATHTPIDSLRKPNYYSQTTSTTPESDTPIVFEDSSTAGSTYVRTSEHQYSHDSFKNNVIENKTVSITTSFSKDVRINGKYLPSPDGKSSPPCAKSSFYCETYENYPRALLNEVLGRSFSPQEFQQIYGETTDNTSTTTDLRLMERTNLSPNSEETPLCSSTEHTIYPRVAKNKDNKWMYVVNHDEYIQGVRVEKCLDEGQSCLLGETTASGYQTACRQKYIYKKLLALTPEGKTSTDSFKLPSCCVCYAKKLSLANRVGVGGMNFKISPTNSTPTTAQNLKSADHDYVSDDPGVGATTTTTTITTTTTVTNVTEESRGPQIRR